MIAQSDPLEYRVGALDGIVGLARSALRQGRLDQALAEGIQAETGYKELGVALGQAEANRVLGEVHLRRGQLGQAV